MRNTKMYNLFLISLVVLVYLSVTLGLYFFQRSLLYHPTENNYSGDKLTVKIEKVNIKTEDNIYLIAWYHKKDNIKFKTILYLHGNAGSLENRIHKINHFNDMEINFLLISWRGFSGNDGKPSEIGLYEDALAAKKWLNSKKIEDKNIILYGESLGTAIALNLAQDYSFSGVILESPFTSMETLAKSYYPYLPVKYLLKDKYNSISKLNKNTAPILVMHGMKDKIVPFKMGKEIYDKFNGKKSSFFVENDDHMMDFNENLINSIELFITELN